MLAFRVHFDTGEVFTVDAQTPEDARSKAPQRPEPRIGSGDRITRIKLDRTEPEQNRRATRLTRHR